MALWQIVCAALAFLLVVFFVLVSLLDPDAAPARWRRLAGRVVPRRPA